MAVITLKEGRNAAVCSERDMLDVIEECCGCEFTDYVKSKVFDERGNKSLQLTKIKWNGKGDFKLQIRNFFSAFSNAFTPISVTESGIIVLLNDVQPLNT